MKPKKPLPPELIEQPLVLYFGLYSSSAYVRVGRARNGYILFTVRGDFRSEFDDPLWAYTTGYRTTVFSVYGRRHFTLSPVGLARRFCDVEVPLKATTCPGIVADWLLDKGREDSSAYRLLMWCHWNLWES